MNITHKMTIREIGIFKMYLASMGILATMLFPSILEVNLRIYVIAFAVTYILFIRHFTRKVGTSIGAALTNWNVHLFRSLSVADVTLFKSTVFLGGIVLVSIFPSLLNIDAAWYIAIACFGWGYMISLLTHSKE